MGGGGGDSKSGLVVVVVVVSHEDKEADEGYEGPGAGGKDHQLVGLVVCTGVELELHPVLVKRRRPVKHAEEDEHQANFHVTLRQYL